MKKEEREKWLSRKRLKTPFPTSKTIRLWQLTYHALLTSFLLGMEHATVDIEVPAETVFSEKDWHLKVKPLPFEEAIKFFAARVPLTKEEFYALEPKFRFRAFTVARLTELDAINRCKGLLKEALEEGMTFQQFWEKGREDVLLKAGFHQTRPWYWETVFRTNIQTAYNAGRMMQIEKAPEVQYLEFVGIRDSRQTDICRARSGVIRPKGDPWWKTNTPPLHFKCRSTVRTISRFEVERRGGIRVTRKKRLENLPPPQEGFGLDPLNSGTFWKLTPSMIERARRYGILGEIRELAKWLGLEKVEQENPGVKFYPKELVERLGKEQKIPFKEGEVIFEELGKARSVLVRSIVLKKFTDLLGNEIYFTSFRRNHILGDQIKRRYRNLYLEEIKRLEKTLKDPDVIIFDHIEKAWLYGKRHKEKWCFAVVGSQDKKVFTMIIKPSIFKRKDRYEVVYVEEGIDL